METYFASETEPALTREFIFGTPSMNGKDLVIATYFASKTVPAWPRSAVFFVINQAFNNDLKQLKHLESELRAKFSLAKPKINPFSRG